MTANAKKYYEDLATLPGSGTPIVMVEIGKRKFQAPFGAGGLSWSYKTANYSIQAGEGVVINSAGTARTITLPATVAEGDEFVVHHLNTSATDVVVTIARNGNSIRYQGSAVGDDVSIANGETIHLVATAAGTLEIV